MPEKMEPAAMPLVTVDEIPAIRRAKAKTMPAASPNNGVSKDWACCNSSTGVPFWKKVDVANRIMALLMAHPTNMENMVS